MVLWASEQKVVDVDKYVKKLDGFYWIEQNCQNLGILRFAEIDTSFLYKVNLIKYTSRMTDWQLKKRKNKWKEWQDMDLSSIIGMLKMLINAPLKMLQSIDVFELFDWDGINFD